MALSNITPDDLGPGTRNRERFEAIRSALSLRYDDDAPFLLLPVRLETRFMRVERAVVGPATDVHGGLRDAIEVLRRLLSTVATDRLGTKLTRENRKAVKEREARIRKQLEASLSSVSLTNATDEIVRALDRTRQLDPGTLEDWARPLFEAIEAARASVAQLRSTYLRARFLERFETFEARGLPDAFGRALRRARIESELKRSSVCHVVPLVGAVAKAAAAAQKDLRGLDELPRIVGGLRAAADTVITGDADELRMLSETARSATKHLEALESRLRSTGRMSKDALDALASFARLVTSLDPNGKRAVTLDGPTLERSASALEIGEERLVSLEHTSTLEARPDLVTEDATATIARLRSMSAALRSAPLLPMKRRTETEARIRDLSERLQPLRRRAANADSVVAGELERRVAEAERIATQIRAEDYASRVYFAPTRVELHEELWVRIYPDDVSVDTHEPGLTDDEIDDARTYWLEARRAQVSDDERRAAFRAVAARHGPRRAAWIIREMTPVRGAPGTNLGVVLRGLDRLDRRFSDAARVRDTEREMRRIERALEQLELPRDLEGTPAQVSAARAKIRALRAKIEGKRATRPIVDMRVAEGIFAVRSRLDTIDRALEKTRVVAVREELDRFEWPVVERREAKWTRPPRAPLLPERFVFAAVDDAEAVRHLVVGEQIVDLALGIDPRVSSADAERFDLDEDGNLVVGASIKWMVDFDEAVARGMAVRIPITAGEAASGFARVYALGVRDLSAAEAKTAVSQMFAAHRFTDGGFAVLPFGTPTNNTEEGPSAFRSDEDADAIFDLELGPPQIPNGDTTADGLRLAGALGLDRGAVDRIPQSGRHDFEEAELVDRVLWHGTGRAYLTEMFRGLVSPDTMERIGAFFTQHVTARGVVPSFRVGPQPYGVSVTTAFSRFVPASGATLPPMPDGVGALTPAQRGRRFNLLLRDVLETLAGVWREARSKVPHAHTPGIVDAQAHFLEMLGLHPTTVSWSHRFALNVAQRTAGSGHGSVRFGTVPSEGPIGFLTTFEAPVRAAFARAGSGVIGANGQILPELESVLEQLTRTRGFGVRFLDTDHALDGALVDGSEIAAVRSAPLLGLAEAAAQGELAPPTSLFAMLLRHARLQLSLAVALDMLQREGMVNDLVRVEAGSSDSFVMRSLLRDVYVTLWSYLFEPPADLDGRFDLTFPTGANTLARYLGGAHAMARFVTDGPFYLAYPAHAQHDADRQRLLDFDADLVRLASVPVERTTRLVAEHLDLLGHRLDAWRSGLAHQRLAEIRAQRRDGLYVGAYGILDEVRRGGARTEAPAVPAALDEPGRATYVDADNNGFIVAPSVAHGVAAAMLRSGYLSESATPDLENRLAVNLSSRRVRMALAIRDAIQSGIDLEVALGYRLERSLHDAYERTGITLDALIAPLRRRFPSVGAVDPASDDPERARRNVIDGLAVLDTVRRNVTIGRTDETLFDVMYAERFTRYPWGLRADDGASLLPPASSAALVPALEAIDAIADALDALGDLAVAEGTYQIARGNFARAAAVMTASAEGRAIPRPEVVDTPGAGRKASHRLILAMRPIGGAPLAFGVAGYEAARDTARPVGWTHGPLTPRAAADPTLNHWLGRRLGPANDITARVVEESEPPVNREVTVADLGLQPIDLLDLLGSGLDDAAPRLTRRVAHAARPAVAVPGEAPRLRVELATRDAGWAAGKKTFLEASALLTSVLQLVAESRAADATDLVDADTASIDAPVVAKDLADFEARVRGSIAEAESLLVDMATLYRPGPPPALAAVLADPAAFRTANRGPFESAADTWAARDAIFARLERAASFALRHVGPPGRFDDLDDARTALAGRHDRAFEELAARIVRARTAIASSADAAALLAAAQAIFTKSFKPSWTFSLDEVPDAVAALADLPHEAVNASVSQIDAWFFGVAGVRDRARRLEVVSSIADAFDRPFVRTRVFQFPRRDDEAWLGGSLPTEGAPDGDRACFAVFDAGEWDASTGAGWVVDEWTETVPDAVRSTATAFHYDAPDAEAPNALLLVVPPERRGRWRWEDLLMAVDETLDLAKSRLVEAEHLQDHPVGQLFPALIGEVVPRSSSLDAEDDIAGSRTILDFGANRAVEP